MCPGQPGQNINTYKHTHTQHTQVYNETIHDLIAPSGNLEMREDPEKGLVVSGLSVHQVGGASPQYIRYYFV